jgi:hypothetical protein
MSAGCRMVTLHPRRFCLRFFCWIFLERPECQGHAVTISITAARVNAMEDVIVSERLPTVALSAGVTNTRLWAPYGK